MKNKEKNKKLDCKKYNDCSAPLCPMDDSLSHGIFYIDEDICASREFQTLDWIKKQKLVVKASTCKDKYFTAEMLKAAKQIRKGTEGIDPDQPLSQAVKAEEAWIKGKQVVAKEEKKPKRVVAKKKDNSGRKTITSLGKRKARLT